MSLKNQLDREIEALEEQLANDDITQKEYNSEYRDLMASAQGYAKLQAEQAYNDCMSDHGF